ncbi:MAG: 6-phosphogluconolactonase, partial [Clostridia bacterium]|nr:6-phosphogluconolactonase [Clostridia bacterium]
MNKLIYTESYDEMSRLAADMMLRIVRENPRAALVIATGGSPKSAYRIFCEKVISEKIDISEVTFIKLDEWLGLSPDDEATCEVFIRRELLDPLGVKDEKYIRFDPLAADVEAECERFEKAYAALEQIDLVILGIGKNGHLGLNEPDTVLFGSAHTMDLDKKTKTHEMLTHADKEVTKGISMGLTEIFRGKEIMLLATGGEKAAGIGSGYS